MARLLFLQDLEFEFLGPACISSYLKKNGHEVRLSIGATLTDFQASIKDFQPDFIAFSVMSGSHLWALEMARAIKAEYSIKSIFGGPHPTHFPDLIEKDGVDIVIRGEGEDAILELLNCFDKKTDPCSIRNLWVKENGQIYRNDVRALSEDLDRYPAPDRELYQILEKKIDFSVRHVITSRGCPYQCTFCFNEAMREIYRDKGKYVRFRNVASVIEECQELRDKYRTKIIFFSDDVFGLNMSWQKEFLSEYSSKVGLPFFCLVRADVLAKNAEYAALLAQSGCKMVSFGIESGDESLRNEVLKKNVSNNHILLAAESLHKAGIPFRTFNILGLPGETLSQALTTVQFNIDIKTDFPWCAVFMPFPGTKLTQQAIESGLLPADYNIDCLASSFFAASNLTRHPHIRELENLQKFFQTAVLLPWTFPFIKKLIHMKPNILFKLWFGFMYFLVYVRAERKDFLKMIWFSLKNFRRLLG
ncbi:MAG TPA: radical SAM protein [Candidatus Omnitrophota bacterium]|nr:radical SAM protein [Candidatus Omnitrophota bacterium]